MRWRESYPGRVWTAISKHGLTAGLQDSLARWSRERMRLVPDVVGEYDWVLTPDRPPLLPSPRSGPLRINWLVNSIEEASGGQLSIIRAIYHLERWGHKHRIYVAGRTRLTEKRATAIARSYYPIQASVEFFQGKTADSDALVATLWKTAYVARGIPNTARKFYFVQDLEHLFHPPGGLAELTKATYRLGLYGIVFGGWIENVLRSEFKMECSSVGFSFDRDVYSSTGPQKADPGIKRVLFYARPKTERRAFELGVLALSLVAQKMPATEFVLVGSTLQPSQLPFRAILPGVVPPAELAAWYRSCTAALVLSCTNLSLVPLELMACGCPVVSNKGPNVEWLLTEDVAQLSEATPQALASAILVLLEDEELRTRKIASAMSIAQRTDTVREMRRFEAAFYQGLNMPPLSAAASMPADADGSSPSQHGRSRGEGAVSR